MPHIPSLGTGSVVAATAAGFGPTLDSHAGEGNILTPSGSRPFEPDGVLALEDSRGGLNHRTSVANDIGASARNGRKMNAILQREQRQHQRQQQGDWAGENAMPALGAALAVRPVLSGLTSTTGHSAAIHHFAGQSEADIAAGRQPYFVDLRMIPVLKDLDPLRAAGLALAALREVEACRNGALPGTSIPFEGTTILVGGAVTQATKAGEYPGAFRFSGEAELHAAQAHDGHVVRALAHIAPQIAVRVANREAAISRRFQLATATMVGYSPIFVQRAAAVRNIQALFEHVRDQGTETPAQLDRQQVRAMAGHVKGLAARAQAVQPPILPLAITPEDPAWEYILGADVPWPTSPEDENETRIEEWSAELIADAPTPGLLHELVRKTTPRAERAEVLASEEKGRCARAARKRAERAVHLPPAWMPVRGADELYVEEGEAHRRQHGLELEAETLRRTSARATAGLKAASYLRENGVQLNAALDAISTPPAHWEPTKQLAVEAALAQMPVPRPPRSQTLSALYSALAGTPDPSSVVNTVLAAEMAAMRADLPDIGLVLEADRRLALGDAGEPVDGDEVMARVGDGMSHLVDENERKAAMVLGQSARPYRVLAVHGSTVGLPLDHQALGIEPVFVEDEALAPYIIVISLYAFQMSDLVFYGEAAGTLERAAADAGFYAFPELMKPLVQRPAYDIGSHPGSPSGFAGTNGATPVMAVS